MTSVLWIVSPMGMVVAAHRGHVVFKQGGNGEFTTIERGVAIAVETVAVMSVCPALSS